MKRSTYHKKSLVNKQERSIDLCHDEGHAVDKVDLIKIYDYKTFTCLFDASPSQPESFFIYCLK